MPLWPASGLLAPTVTPSANLDFPVIESSLPGFASELFATDLVCPPLWASTTVLFEPFLATVISGCTRGHIVSSGTSALSLYASLWHTRIADTLPRPFGSVRLLPKTAPLKGSQLGSSVYLCRQCCFSYLLSVEALSLLP